MRKDLPYNVCYGVVEGFNKDESFHINLYIRNPLSTEFHGNFELTSRSYITSGFKLAYGGQLEVTPNCLSFGLTDLEDAAKVLRKAYKKSDAMSKKYGYTNSATELIIRQLQATGAKEVRIADPEERFNGWNLVDPLSVKDDIEIIRIRLNKMEAVARKIYPFTDKI
jgi:hypothetical protein